MIAYPLAKLYKIVLLCTLWSLCIALPSLSCPRGLATTSVAFSPDAKVVASIGCNNEVLLWDTNLGKELVRFQKHTDDVIGIAYSPNGDLVASASRDASVKLWKADSGDVVQDLLGHEGAAISVAFSPDGKTLASGGRDKTIRVWDVTTGRQLAVLSSHERPINSLVFSKNGKWLASGSDDKTIKLWNAQSRVLKQTLLGHKSRVVSLGFSPDGKLLASGGYDPGVRIWDVANGRELYKVGSEIPFNCSVAFSPDGKILGTISSDGFRLWELKSKGLFRPEIRSWTLTSTMIDSRTGRVIAKGAETDADTNEPLYIWGSGSNSIVFSADGTMIAVGSASSYVELVDARSVKPFIGFGQRMTRTVSFSPDGRLAATCSGFVQVWDLIHHKVLRTFFPEDLDVYSAHFLKDGKTLVCNSHVRPEGPQTIVFFDVGTCEETARIETNIPMSQAGDFAISTNEAEIAAPSRDDRTIHFFDRQNGKELMPIKTAHTNSIKTLQYSPDGLTIATGSYDNTIKLFEISSGKEIRTFKGHTGTVDSLEFSRDGTHLISLSYDKSIIAWDVATGKIVRKLDSLKSTFSYFAVSPTEDKIVAGCSSRILRVWNWRTGEQYHKYGYKISGAKYLPDGKRFALLSDGHNVRFFDADTLKDVGTLE